MTPIVWPDSLRPSSMKWGQSANAVVFTSPFNGAAQTVGFPGDLWTCSMTFNSLDDDESRLLESILFQLRGPQGRVLLRDFGRVPPAQLGSPVVSSAGQMGLTLVTRGWTASKAVLRQGDYISVANEMKMVVADVTSAVDGSATIQITPPWRYAKPINTPVVVTDPRALFRLKDNNQSADRKPAFDNTFTLEFVEHPYAS